MEEKKIKTYYTRMYLKEEKGWTNKMIEVLLKDVPYTEWGNYYRWRYNKKIQDK